jgi:hypothetical protein
VSRSKHTDPRRLRAARRLRDPREPRGAGDPARHRRLLRRLKEKGVVLPTAVKPDTVDWPLPRVSAVRPRPGFLHPAGPADVAEVLRFFGEEVCYGLTSVELRAASPEDDRLAFGAFFPPGRIVLYDQRPSPWRIPGALAPDEMTRLRRAGATLSPSGDAVTTVVWPGSTLRDFMRIDVLMHEIGHHLLQHEPADRRRPAARTRDHEEFAERFARRCRRVWRVRGPGR